MSKETDMTKNKISTYSTIRNNTNQVFYNNSYVKDDINYTIYNLNDSNLSKSKYSSFMLFYIICYPEINLLIKVNT